MGATVLVGSQFGDEGKGKIVDLLAENFDLVVRFHGGPNAGHTVRVGEQTLKLHHLPSAVLRPNCRLVIANGVVVDPEILLKELAELKEQGIDLTGRLLISKDCPVILPYHRTLEKIYGAAKRGSLDPRSTGRGIGPVHADKVSYLGLKLADLYQPKVLHEKLEVNVLLKRPLIEAFGEEIPTAVWLREHFEQLGGELQPYVGETVGFLHRALDQGARVLLEGAQGTFLDVDHGFYPFVTASNAVAGAVNAGAGIPPRAIERVIGVAKAYVTRVGDGPFPTEMPEKLAAVVQEQGGERGTTTGRLRRVGWLDVEMITTAAKLSGFDELVLTKLDVLSGLKELKAAIGLIKRRGFKEVSYLSERDPEEITQVKPSYASFTPWEEPLTSARSWEDLPAAARHYVSTLERLNGIPITIISVGPERSETIWR